MIAIGDTVMVMLTNEQNATSDNGSLVSFPSSLPCWGVVESDAGTSWQIGFSWKSLRTDHVSITVDKAMVTPVAAMPASGLGTDLSCVSDLSPTMTEVSGRTALGQSIARRLQTPRGGLIDDPNYGFGLTEYLNDDLSQTDISNIAANVEAECLKDERVVAATATVVYVPAMAATGSLIVTIMLTDGVGPFPLVLSVTNVSVSILSASQ